MQSAPLPVALLTVAILTAAVPLAAASTPDESARVVGGQAQQPGSNAHVLAVQWTALPAQTVTYVERLVEAGYRRAPALVMVLAAMFVLPAVAIASLLVRVVLRRRSARAANASSLATSMNQSGAGSTGWPRPAWLMLETGSAQTVPLAGALIRLGRDQDNDIQLPDTSVHRYHAVIERTPEAAFVITDLGGERGNGVRINGARQARAELAHGDVIELGATRMKFQSLPV